jgi:nitrate/TMAO reductase-like tetraheme cytochrome c subunit
VTDTVEIKPFVASDRRSEVATKLAARAKVSSPAAHAKGIAASAAAKPSAKTVEKQIKELSKDEIDKHKDIYKEAKENKEHKDAK